MRICDVTRLVLILPLVGGCRNPFSGVKGSGIAKTESRAVGDFDEVEIHGAGRIEFSTGTATPLSVTADDNILPLLITTVTNRKLTIRSEESIQPNVDMVYKATVPNIKGVSLHGAAKILLNDIKNDSLTVNLSGAGDVVATGKTDSLTFRLSGAGSLKGYDLVARTADAEVSGVGSAELNVKEKLVARVSGIGSIKYLGDPKVDSKVTGIGKVSKRD